MNTIITTNAIAPTSDDRRVVDACPRLSLRLLAPVCVIDQGWTPSAADQAQTVVRPKAGVPAMGGAFVGGYAPVATSTHKTMDVVHIRSGRPPV